MFTGLITDIGKILRVEPATTGGRVFVIATSYDIDDLELGESIAVDGACLTVTRRHDGAFEIDASPETLARTTLGDRRQGEPVHLERALRVGDRLGGHFVLGHVDGVGHVRKKRRDGNAWVVDVEAPESVLPFLIEKGSVTLDGVSLTVNRVDANGFSVAIVPFTVEKTNLGSYTVGRAVNLEADVLGKYVHRILGGSQKITLPFLERHGFAPEGSTRGSE